MLLRYIDRNYIGRAFFRFYAIDSFHRSPSPPGRALYLLEVDRVALPDDGKMFASVNDHARLPSRNHF